MKPNTIHHGDCLDVMREMEENSVDAVVCDPPYGLEFMGMKWDRLGNIGEGKSKTPAPAKSGQAFNERIGRVSYNASQNVKCRKCKHWKFSGTPCKCTSPDFPNIRSAQAQAMQGWHFAWACEALRVAKPGAYLLAFGGTRTFHRLACAIEDAGWMLKDTMMWVYGSGFPKSHDVSKALDRKAGAEREVVGKETVDAGITSGSMHAGRESRLVERDVTVPATPEAKQWNGFGTALKPSWEPIVLAQAPLEGTYAENVLKWGCGALNIDGCRIGTDKITTRLQKKAWGIGGQSAPTGESEHQGRWPANFLLSHTMFCEKVGEKRVKASLPASGPTSTGESTSNSRGKFDGRGNRTPPNYADADGFETIEDWRCVPDCPVAMLDKQSGELKSGRLLTHHKRGGGKPPIGTFEIRERTGEPCNFGGDQGGASRFFYCAKASTQERNAGLEEVLTLFERRQGFEEKSAGRWNKAGEWTDNTTPSANNHPTVKPIALLRYLCRLVTPPGGLVLDPFTGSGSTGCAAVLEGFRFVGIEKEKEYTEIAEARIEHWAAMA